MVILWTDSHRFAWGTVRQYQYSIRRPCPQQMPSKLSKLKVTRGRSFSSLRCQAKRLCPTLVVILQLQAVGSTKGNHLLVEDGIE